MADIVQIHVGLDSMISRAPGALDDTRRYPAIQRLRVRAYTFLEIKKTVYLHVLCVSTTHEELALTLTSFARRESNNASR